MFFFFFIIINEGFHGNFSGPRTVCDSSNLINLIYVHAASPKHLALRQWRGVVSPSRLDCLFE